MAGWFKREIISEISHLGISTLLKFASPFLLAGAAIVTGWMEHMPLLWIVMATTVTFAMTAIGLLSFYVFLYALTPENKLHLLTPTFAWVASENDPEGRAMKMGQVRLIANFSNQAHFPISVITDEFDVVIDGNINTVKTARGVSLILGAKQNGWFRDDLISLKGVPCTNFDGKAHIRVRYGRPGKEKFRAGLDLAIRLIFDQTKGLYSLDVVQDIQARTGGGA